MGICNIPMGDGKLCQKETVWNECCEDHQNDYHLSFDDESDEPTKPTIEAIGVCFNEKELMFLRQTLKDSYFKDTDHTVIKLKISNALIDLRGLNK